jgi:hypothetical protein
MQQSHNHLFPERHRRNPEFEEGVVARKYEISPAVADVMNLVRRIDGLLAAEGDRFVSSVGQRDGSNQQTAPAQSVNTAESAEVDVPAIDPAIVAGAVVNASMVGREPELFSEDVMQDPNYIGGIALEGSDTEQL